MSQFGAMLVNGEYQKNDGSATGSATMNISFPLYLGGVPDDVQLTTLKVCFEIWDLLYCNSLSR